MRVLRRFPVSDEFNSDRKTLDSVRDRMKFFELFQFAFFEFVLLLFEDSNGYIDEISRNHGFSCQLQFKVRFFQRYGLCLYIVPALAR